MRRALLLTLLLAACAPVQWVKPEASAEQAELDAQACRDNAWREVTAWNYYAQPFAPLTYRDPFGRRYFGWGSGPFSDPFGDRFFDESRLANFCMRSKGYELVPADKIQPSPAPAPEGKP